MKFPAGWDVRAIRVFGLLQDGIQIILLFRSRPTFYAIWMPGSVGGWHYRNDWAATAAFTEWDGEGAPAAGEWADFK